MIYLVAAILVLILAALLWVGVTIRNQGASNVSAIDNLTANVAENTTATNAAVAALAVPHPTDAAIQSAADTIAANTAALNTAVAAQ